MSNVKGAAVKPSQALNLGNFTIEKNSKTTTTTTIPNRRKQCRNSVI